MNEPGAVRGTVGVVVPVITLVDSGRTWTNKPYVPSSAGVWMRALKGSYLKTDFALGGQTIAAA